MLVIIAAMGSNGVIGRDGRLPWSLPVDMARFKRLTMGNPVIMGRTTFESIGSPLGGRFNIVMTRDPGYSRPGVAIAQNATRAIELAGAHSEGGDIYVIGGAQVYAVFLPFADRMELTVIDSAPEGDARFPDWNTEEWREIAAVPQEGPPRFTFRTLERVR